MNEVRLGKISFICVVFGLIILYFLVKNPHYFHVNIGDINSAYVGRIVNITGEITGLTENEGNLFFSAKDKTGEIKVVLWSDTIGLLKLKGMNIDDIENGKAINIIGNIQLYRGELEVIPMRGKVKLL